MTSDELYWRNHALSRATGNAATTHFEPDTCHCMAFNWPHLQGVSRQCAIPYQPRRLRKVLIDDWRIGG